VRPSVDGLVIDPCIPKRWKNYTVHRVFRGTTYHIKVSNPKGVSKGIKQLTVDGAPIEGNVIPIPQSHRAVHVEAQMG
jgi:cellobiose phosphorylase